MTSLLREWRGGDRQALDRLLPLVYEELRRIAARHLLQERAGHTLPATALVHEAYLKLVDLRRVDWQDRAHFLGVAARLMRQVLVDHARARRARKRGGGETLLALPAEVPAAPPRDVDLLDLDAALERLAAMDEGQARIVELRFFGGLTIEETAEVMGSSSTTVKRDWHTARIWLFRELRGA